MPKSVCVKCEVELKIARSGVKVLEMFQHNTSIYKVWDADLWECPHCGLGVVLGFAQYPLMEHYQGDIYAFVEKLKAAGNIIIYDKEL